MPEISELAPRARPALVLFCLALAGCSSDSEGDVFGGSGGTCDLLGTFGTFVEVGVEWESGTIKPGAGTTRQWILSTRERTSTGYRDTGVSCGIGARLVPSGSPWFATRDFRPLGIDVGSEWTGVTFDVDLFDGGQLPVIPIDITVGGPDPASAAIGTRLRTTSPPFEHGSAGIPADVWPARADFAPFLRDQDGDGQPGLTGSPFQGQVRGEPPGTQFVNPRLDVAPDPPRTDALYMAIRTRAFLDIALVSCDPPRFEGTVQNGSLLIETRAVACRVAQTGLPCDETQVDFIDGNLPQFKANGVSRVVSLALPAGATCADVRRALADP
ncbi:MAG: hypothetical protein FJ104_10670 [Deltaproteobacteria bacterium]|nr:hypothetical protein [Deltaproteobacteria bacterium]